MNDITKGVRGAKDYYIINTPILRAIQSKAIFQTGFLFCPILCFWGYVTIHNAILSYSLSVKENIIKKKKKNIGSTMIAFEIRKANKRTNMLISVKKPKK